MSRLKFKLIRYILLAYVLLTAWQVFAKREDFPLSSFPMFARNFPGKASRTLLVGVNEHGETTLDPHSISGLMSTPRLQKIFQGLQKKSDAEQADFMARIADILSTNGDADERLWGVRFYTESWRTQLHLKGMDHPSRDLEFAAYIAPPGLKHALEREAKGDLKPPRPEALPRGDWLIELDASACGADCSMIPDALGAHGNALLLKRGGSLHVTLPAGSFALFVRMRTRARAGDDHLTVTVDGKRPKDAKEGIGNYKHALPYDAWVWASLEPGWPALRIKAKNEGSELTLGDEHADVELDQIWLATTRSELPTFNAPLTRTKTGEQQP